MRICLVERENIVRNTLQDFLSDLGHAVLIFNALDDLSTTLDRHARSVDLIITDLLPANGKAISLLRTLHQRCPDIPFIITSTSNGVLPAREALQCGVYGYLHKPFRLAELELMLLRLAETHTNGSLQDEHTGVYQRLGFIALVQQQLRVANRTKTRLSFLITDRNGTKSNDGEADDQEADRSLTELGMIVRETFRDSDIMGRFNGKDYGVLLVDTSEEGAEIAISRLQKNIKAHNARENRSRKLSVDVGVAYYDPDDPRSLDDLATRADLSMQREKG